MLLLLPLAIPVLGAGLILRFPQSARCHAYGALVGRAGNRRAGRRCLAGSRARRIAAGTIPARRRPELVFSDGHRVHFRPGAGVCLGLSAPHWRRTFFIAALVLRPGFLVSFHDDQRLPLGKPRSALDHDGRNDAGVGPARGLLQHRRRSRSRLEVSDRLHGGNCLRAVWHHRVVSRRRQGGHESGCGARLGLADECRAAHRTRPAPGEARICFRHRRLRNEDRLRSHAQLAAGRARGSSHTHQRLALRRPAQLRHVRLDALRRNRLPCRRARLFLTRCC